MLRRQERSKIAERMTVTFEKTCLGDLQEGERAVREDPEDGLLLVLHHKVGAYCVFADRDGNSAGGIHGENWEEDEAWRVVAVTRS